MGSEFEVDKERNMDSHRRGEKDRQGRSERKGRRVALERGDKGAWKRSWQRCSVDRRVGLARHGNGARRLLLMQWFSSRVNSVYHIKYSKIEINVVINRIRTADIKNLNGKTIR